MNTHLSTHAHALQTARQRLMQEPCAYPDPHLDHHALSTLTETWLSQEIARLFPEQTSQHMLVYALGSLARRELCLHSDLDILIELHEPALITAPDFLTSITTLMDSARALKIRLKHVVRTTHQNQEEIRKDWRTPIALLDARLLMGEEHKTQLAQSSHIREDALRFLRGDDEGRSFVQRLLVAHLERRERQNQSVYLLEPDLKAGLGALRDLHTIRWANMVRFLTSTEQSPALSSLWGERQQALYDQSLQWLLGLRMHLHSLHNRAQDRLRFVEQERIAHCIYPTQKNPTEHLMRAHYQMTRSGLKQLERSLRLWGPDMQSELALKDITPDATQLTPMQCLDTLEQASTRDLLLAPELEVHITEEVHRWPADILNDTPLQLKTRDLLTDLNTSPRTSYRLLDLGLLTRFLPEFIPLVCHVQHDTYHVYTTDVHTLKCLERARRVLTHPEQDQASQQWPAFAQIASKIDDPHILLLAALLHDIGKNRGGDHSNKGADLVPIIAQRWHIPTERALMIEKLVRQHLLLSNTSRRLDISDPKVIDSLVETVDSLQCLYLLTTLTFCDMSTVSSTAMNDWRAHLLLQLHHNIEQRLLEKQEHREEPPQAIEERVAETISHEQVDYLDDNYTEHLETFIHDLPEDALSNLPKEALKKLFLTYHQHTLNPDKTSILIEELDTPYSPQEEPSQRRFKPYKLILATRDSAGTLAKIAGVLSANGLNILSAEIISTRSGRILDMFHIEKFRTSMRPNSPAPEFSPARQERLTTQLRAVLDEGADVQALLDQRLSQQPLVQNKEPNLTIEVTGRQDLSDDYTVLELHGPDRQGLLHDIASALHTHQIEIKFSKLDLLGNQAIDTFYVESILDGKLSTSQLEQIKEVLLEVLRHGYDAD